MHLIVKFNVKAHKALIAEGDGARLAEKMDLDQSLVDRLLESLK